MIMTTVKLGSRGEDVRILQKYLGLTADGVFGSGTDKRVKEWQRKKGLTPDGIVGPHSWEIIQREMAAAVQSAKKVLTVYTTGLSAGMIAFICRYETGKSFGYTMTARDLNGYDLHDANGHRTCGYGLLCHPATGKYMDTIKQRWTQTELEQLFLEHARQASQRIDSWAAQNRIKLNQNQKDAIASGCYNFGYGFLQKQVCKMIIANPNNKGIRSVWEHLSDVQGKKYPGLITRRRAEARWYFEGK